MYFHLRLCFFSGIPIGIDIAAKGLKICVTTAAIKKYKSVIEKKKKKYKIAMSVKTKLNSKEVLLSKALIDSNIIDDEFVLINNVLIEYNDMKQEINNIKTSSVN